jgi:hypothetical protein
MAVEDYLDPEVAVAVAVTAAVASPRARRVMRRGAVLGMAGVLKAGDALGSFAQGVGRGARQAASPAGDAVESVTGATGETQPGSPAARPMSTRPQRSATAGESPETQAPTGVSEP